MEGCKGRIQARAVLPLAYHQCSIPCESSCLAHVAEQAEIDARRPLVILTNKSRICKLSVGQFQSHRGFPFPSNRNFKKAIMLIAVCPAAIPFAANELN